MTNFNRSDTDSHTRRVESRSASLFRQQISGKPSVCWTAVTVSKWSQPIFQPDSVKVLGRKIGWSSRNNVRASEMEIGSTTPNFVQWQAFVDTKMQVQRVFLRTKQAHEPGINTFRAFHYHRTHHISLFLHAYISNFSVVLRPDTVKNFIRFVIECYNVSFL